MFEFFLNISKFTHFSYTKDIYFLKGNKILYKTSNLQKEKNVRTDFNIVNFSELQVGRGGGGGGGTRTYFIKLGSPKMSATMVGRRRKFFNLKTTLKTHYKNILAKKLGGGGGGHGLILLSLIALTLESVKVGFLINYNLQILLLFTRKRTQQIKLITGPSVFYQHFLKYSKEYSLPRISTYFEKFFWRFLCDFRKEYSTQYTLFRSNLIYLTEEKFAFKRAMSTVVYKNDIPADLVIYNTTCICFTRETFLAKLLLYIYNQGNKLSGQNVKNGVVLDTTSNLKLF